VFFIFWAQIDVVNIRTSTYFLLGIFLGTQTKRKISTPIFPLLIASIAILILSSFVSDGIYQRNSKHEYIWCLVLFSLLWSVSQRYKNAYIVNIFAWAGKNSLSILVLHAFFVVSMKSTHKIFLSIDPTGLVYSVFVTLFTVACCLLLSHIFDKLKLSPFLFGVPKIYSPYKNNKP
jgi:fucose 4-O-acetylase-like acetyltransferase